MIKTIKSIHHNLHYSGKLQLVLVKPFLFYIYSWFVIFLFIGGLRDSMSITYLETEKLLRKSDFKLFYIDGKPLSFAENLSISMKPEKRRIIKTKYNNL